MGNVKLRIWDVKHGNAAFVQAPNGKILVFDLGRGDYSENSEDRSPLETLYDHYGVRTIDLLVISHPHKDHIDDILNVRKFRIATLMRPKGLDKAAIMGAASDRDRPKYQEYFRLDEEYNTSSTGSYRSSVPENYGGLEIKFFQTPQLKTNLNNRSIITVLKYEGMKVVLTGDNEYESLDLLMQRDDFNDAIKNCDILLVPHHGRQSAYHGDFLRHTNPRIAVISDGSICDTSANPKYSANARGWQVKKNSVKTERKLLTTNCDGEIYIDFGSNNNVGRYLSVQIK